MKKISLKTLTRTYSHSLALLFIFTSYSTPALAQDMNYIMPPYQTSQPTQNNDCSPPSNFPLSANQTPSSSSSDLTAEQVNQAAALTNQAYQLSKDGNNEQAVELLKQALIIDPSSTVAHLDLSLALIALKQYDEALKESSIVLQLNPDEEKGYLNYLAAAIGANRMQDALRVGQEYLTRFPNGNSRKTLTNEMVAVEHELDRRANSRGIMAPPGAPDNYLFLVTPYGKRHWPSYITTLKVYIYPGDKYKGFLPIYQTSLISSFMTWQNATCGGIRFIPVSDPSIADIECRWTDSVAGLTLAAEAGDTKIMGNREAIYHVIITILTCRPDIPSEKLTPALIQQVCLHEIGHGLGFDGHSDSAQDIMYCATDPNVEHVGLSLRDINTLFLLYH